MPRTTRSRRDDIVRAAARIFHDKGYSASTIQDVANSVGLLKGSLYHYITTKEDLLFMVMYDAHARALESTRLKIANLSDIEALRKFIYESVLFIAENPEKSSAFYRDARHLTGDHLATIVDLRRVNDKLSEELIASAQATGIARSDNDARLLSNAVLGLITSIVNWYRPTGRLKPPEVATAYTDLAFSMLGVVEPPAKPKRASNGPVSATARRPPTKRRA